MRFASLLTVLMLLGGLVGCDAIQGWLSPIDPATRYERQGDLILDTATGLTYDAADAAAEREVYREVLIARGEELPGLPLVLDDEQRQTLYASEQWAAYRVRAQADAIRNAQRRAEWEEACEEALPHFDGEGPGSQLNGLAELMRKALVEQCLDAVEARFDEEAG